jgi:hypothetical protein
MLYYLYQLNLINIQAAGVWKSFSFYMEFIKLHDRIVIAFISIIVLPWIN